MDKFNMLYDHKYPLAKPMLLLKSKIEVKNNTINVKMHIRGARIFKRPKNRHNITK